jgi:hypothetical protein
MTKIKYPTLGKKTKRKAKPAAKSPAKPKAKRLAKSNGKLILREDSVAYVVNNPDLVTLEEAARLTNKTTHNIRDYIRRDRICRAAQW